LGPSVLEPGTEVGRERNEVDVVVEPGLDLGLLVVSVSDLESPGPIEKFIDWEGSGGS
jgi:hypothetical protein